MLRHLVLGAMTVACGLAASQAAYAGVKFIGTSVGPPEPKPRLGTASPKSRSQTLQSRGDQADTLKKAKAGITALPIASASSGGTRNAFADDAESASVKLTSKPTPTFALAGRLRPGLAPTPDPRFRRRRRRDVQRFIRVQGDFGRTAGDRLYNHVGFRSRHVRL